MTHFRKYWLWYALAAVALIAIIVWANWETVRAWFPAAGTRTANGNRGSVRPPLNPVQSPNNPCIDANGNAVCGDLPCINIGGTAYCRAKR